MLGLAAALLSYLLGSFPTAYVFGKHFRGIDISKNGSGNIGAMNAYDVTGSKAIGITVGSIDVAKGFAATVIPHIYLGSMAGLVSALFVVTGHNYSSFMKFKGGRGLASAAGALLVLQPLCLPVYLGVYYFLRTAGFKLYLSSVAGIISASVPLFWGTHGSAASIFLSAALMIVVLSKHIAPLKNEMVNVN